MTSNDTIGHVSIAVLTYKRPADIVALLPMLVQQAAEIREETSILVIDNDPEAGARQAVEDLALDSVRYVHETAPGIAHARNRALDEASGSHLLVFIDDDERPEPHWLCEMVECYRRERSAGVAGAVVAADELVQDPWIRAGGFFVRLRPPTGTEVPAAGSGNLLIDLHQLDAMGGPRFDIRFGSTGGSDTLFTRTMIKRGGRIVFCDEAAIIDHMPAERLSRSWVLRRAFRSGNSWSRTAVEIEPNPVTRLAVRIRLTGPGLVRIFAGFLRSLLGIVSRSQRHHARGSRTAARGAGMALGAWGVVYEEYRRHDSKGST